MEKVSSKIKAFLDFLNAAETQYALALEEVRTEEKRTQDLLHAIEFEPHAEERSKVATKMRASRLKRRENKDIVEDLEPVVDFMQQVQNRKAVENMSRMLGKVRKAESYHANRKYYPRVEKWTEKNTTD